MKSPTRSVDVVAIILEFIEIQNSLLKAFREKYSQIIDWKYLLDSPRSGYILAQNEEWKFQRHGVGICFTGQKSGKVVDVHVGMSEYPTAFDVWRLCQYFESIGIEKIGHLSKDFDVTDEDGIEELFNCLLQDGLIAESEQRKLYTFMPVPGTEAAVPGQIEALSDENSGVR
ncbi:DUF6896 domain-containing protein [Iningainema tapete]|uniref:DUF6896 domain-containing protein n=1 Tax=Iningainema tapete BLCC-T55 TaxID=2748662 RepID=A0A8J6XHY0_9CYAN|nr:hypothetical protein [Iningainema tapete]MBD2773022.1 hypothetical protein [Iningainema tapete BLCC-T55]